MNITGKSPNSTYVDEIVKLGLTVDTTVDLDESDLTPIQEFYRDSIVFITGCTGLLGNVLLEKLLRSCPVSKIYVLIRNKKGKNTETRLEDIFSDPAFQRINNQFPETRKKVVPVEGDCTLPDLGLGDQDKKLLIDEVDIIFHVAATVRFDETIKTAVLTNIRAPRDLLRLAQRMPKLKSYMHVSTFYSNCIHKVMEEDIYPPAAKYEGMIAMAESVPENILDKLTPRIIGSYPNTYAFTKQIAEDAVRQEGRGLPIGIQRPSIVISTYKEPIKGWSNNIYGIVGGCIGAGVGLLKIMHMQSDYIANIVPADMCINSLIAAAWDVAEAFKKAEDEQSSFKIPVYNYESSNDRPITWGGFVDQGVKTVPHVPSVRSIWYCCLSAQKYYPLFLIQIFFLHTIPGFLMDGVLLCLGKPAMMTKIYKKIKKFCILVSYFNTNQWAANSQKVTKMIAKMTERDRRIFFCDLKELCWDEFFNYFGIGSRTYLLKESPDTLPKARILYNRLYWLHQATKTILGILFLWATWSLMYFVFNYMFSD